MEFFIENANINPLEKFLKLNEISKSPLAVYFKNNTQFLLSASPERYIKKEGELIISQPIKGTAKRFLDPTEDEKSKNELALDPKERSENIMVSDLVRNDLSRTAQKGSVKVEELCGIYSFEQVHQMISTITSKLDSQYTGVDVIKDYFSNGKYDGNSQGFGAENHRRIGRNEKRFVQRSCWLFYSKWRFRFQCCYPKYFVQSRKKIRFLFRGKRHHFTICS